MERKDRPSHVLVRVVERVFESFKLSVAMIM